MKQSTNFSPVAEQNIRRKARIQKILGVMAGAILAALASFLLIQPATSEGPVGFFQFMPAIAAVSVLAHYAFWLALFGAIMIPGILWEGADRRIEEFQRRRESAHAARVIEALMQKT